MMQYTERIRCFTVANFSVLFRERNADSFSDLLDLQESCLINQVKAIFIIIDSSQKVINNGSVFISS